MSQENVEIVRRAIDTYNRRDAETASKLVTPDFEWFTVMGAVEGEAFRGPEGIETYIRNLSDTWEELRMVGGELRDLGDRVLWLGRMAGQGRGSGVPVDAPLAVIYDVRGGKVSRARSYRDHGEALRAAGLSESSGQADDRGSTTPDLVELTRLAFAALNRGEFGIAYSSPEIVLDTAGYGMGTFNGLEAAIGFLEDWTSSFEDLTIETDEILDLGNGVVLTVYHQTGRPLGGTKYVRVRSAAVAVWVDGMMVRSTIYTEAEIDKARAAPNASPRSGGRRCRRRT